MKKVLFLCLFVLGMIITNIDVKAVSIGGINVDTVTSGDGLYEDGYEKGRYIYRGVNPDNYIKFNDELWRIISVEADGSIKIMRSQSLGDMEWDDDLSNPPIDWAMPVSLNTYLNEEYIKTLKDSDKIVSHDFSIGSITYNNRDLAGQISDENSYKWNGKIGLITLSEYLRTNSDMVNCGTFGGSNETCLETSWMGKVGWTITPNKNGNIATVGTYNHNIFGWLAMKGNSFSVRPALYLSSEISLKGEGTEGNPYQFVKEEIPEEITDNESGITESENEVPQIVEVPSTSAYGSIIIIVLGIICIIVSVFVMMRVTKKEG